MARMTMSNTTTGVLLEIERNVQTFSTMAQVIDRRWRWIDSNGHEHSGEDIDATTKRKYGRRYWCNDCGDWHRHFKGYYCVLCSEQVQPRMVKADDISVPGVLRGMLTIDGVGRWDLSARAIDSAMNWVRTNDGKYPTQADAEAWLDDKCYQIERWTGTGSGH